MTAIAITDHDTVDAFHCLKMGQPTNLEVITGIEFSTEFENHEVHILGYGIDVANQELLATLQQLRVERKYGLKPWWNASKAWVPDRLQPRPAIGRAWNNWARTYSPSID